MPKIIYRRGQVLPWDTQSAFKMKYYTSQEDKNTVFCYLKGYVLGDDLSLCVYFFEDVPTQRDKLTLSLNLTPQRKDSILKIRFGYRGVNSRTYCGKAVDSVPVKFKSYKANDEQGYYWCAEISLAGDKAKEIFGDKALGENILAMNLVRHFEDGNLGSLSSAGKTADEDILNTMEIFTVIDY